MPYSDNVAQNQAIQNQEMTRQVSQDAACADQSTHQAVHRASDIRYYREIIKSAQQTGSDCGQALTALRELGAATIDTISRTTNDPFGLIGGTFTVEISGGTFEPDVGILELLKGEDVLATWSDNGAQEFNLEPGDYHIDGANAGSWTATITG